MSQYNFLPSFSIALLDNSNKVKKAIDSDPNYDIFKGNVAAQAFPIVNYDKLQQYVIINLKI